MNDALRKLVEAAEKAHAAIDREIGGHSAYDQMVEAMEAIELVLPAAKAALDQREAGAERYLPLACPLCGRHRLCYGPETRLLYCDKHERTDHETGETLDDSEFLADYSDENAVLRDAVGRDVIRLIGELGDGAKHDAAVARVRAALTDAGPDPRGEGAKEIALGSAPKEGSDGP